MATGYTREIAKGISFEKFALICARGMGACITMRDDDMDTPIPQKFEPSDYHLKEMEKVVDQLCGIDTSHMSGRKGIDYNKYWTQSRRASRKSAKYAKEQLAKQQALKAKYEEMLAKVNAWVPPSPDHENLKKFMIEQITSSIDWDCNPSYYLRQINEKPQSGKQYYTALLDTMVGDLRYHREQYRDEVKRAEDRTRWVQQLRDSLFPANTTTGENRNGEACQG